MLPPKGPCPVAGDQATASPAYNSIRTFWDDLIDAVREVAVLILDNDGVVNRAHPSEYLHRDVVTYAEAVLDRREQRIDAEREIARRSGRSNADGRPVRGPADGDLCRAVADR